MIKKLLAIKPEPWISVEARNWLEDYLTNRMIVFEYGSGGSTVYLARKVNRLITVEHQLLWFLGVLLALVKYRVGNCSLKLARPEKRLSPGTDYASSDPIFKPLAFKKFVQTIDNYPDHYFDLVFIDGRARNDCIKHALAKVKNGGVILLDDAHRPDYKPGKEYLAKYREINFGKTSVWKIK